MNAETPPPMPEDSPPPQSAPNPNPNPGPPPSSPPSQGMSENTWCMIAHLLGFCGYLGNGIGSVIGPLVIWLIKKDEAPNVGEHAREALNFNISMLIYSVVCVVLIIATFGIGAVIGVPALIAIWVTHLICTIIAAIKANQGIAYRYPFTLRLVN